ncbi:hypothetical protein RA19_14895 [Leisingera sp. ANG-M1]|uniref:Coenzyme F420 hydrogenase/dehydrogenase, beta subunit C-terminal domain n=1 Tax=Leisingera sp. ANG-M1 TaxID=1577895 RepID=UPI00057E2717|nr:Coenzyme F420 hydrogenase/dehydrogenase, beta subunit C-terminal domain [Leisingera sp. ANG-M1]KIC09605.1 hypothetical protein RA19_14895 [Leisingera sp. ANG-M1]
MACASQPQTLSDIVESGLCVGCGLCQAIAGPEAVQFVTTPEGRERPLQQAEIVAEGWQAITRTCPGTHVIGRDELAETEGAEIDPVWGPYRQVQLAHASDKDIRYRAASGGVLTALAKQLLESGQVKYILQVRASEERPMRSETVMSRTEGEVIQAAGSRYGPATPLAAIRAALDTGEPFAFIGKPCDVTALRLYAREDARVDQQCKAMLAMVCGGAPEFRKSRDLVQELGYSEDDVTLFRYRGYGNPGRARIEFADGHAEERSYLELWADEGKWCIQPRCKICPDAIGESADVAAADYWPGGAPVGEDAGFNSILIRSKAGEALVAGAVEDGNLTITRALDIRDMDDTQPHQVRKKQALWARFAGMRAAGHRIPHVEGLRLEALARTQPLSDNLAAARGSRQRSHAGRLSEPPARDADALKPGETQ